MSLNAFLDELASQGVQLAVEGEQLRIRAKQGVLTPELRSKISERKADLLLLLQGRENAPVEAELPKIIADDKNRFEPFPLTDIQHAYWVGRDEFMELGNTGVHAYLEIDQDDLDLPKLNKALQILINRHDMLRMIIHPNGEQRILREVADYIIEFKNFDANEIEKASESMKNTRTRMSHQILSTDTWPLFEICATTYEENKTRLHISLDILMADLWSLFRIFSEWKQLYDNSASQLPELGLSFRDYVIAEQALENTAFYKAAQTYWRNRLDELQSGPELPLAKQPALVTKPRFKRRNYELDQKTWDKIRKIAAGLEVTPSGLLLSAFAEVLSVWCKTPKFTLNLTLFNRLAMHENVNNLVGDFTTTILLAIDNTDGGNFETRAQRIQKQLYADLEHRVYNGVRVLRDLSQQRAGLPGVSMPVVFSSALGLGSMEEGSVVDTRLGGQLGNVSYTITQTPQVWIDHQVFENNGALNFNWDVVEELFPAGMIDAMFTTYCDLLLNLAESSEAWAEAQTVSLPASQINLRNEINSTEKQRPSKLLHELVLDQTPERSQLEAVIDGRRRMTYGEVFSESNQLGRKLQSLSVKPDSLIAVVLEKGWEQVVSVLGVLASGAAYLPIDPELPETRRDYLLSHAEVDVVLTSSELAKKLSWPEGVTCLVVDSDVFSEFDAGPLKSVQNENNLAYVIYTSGSTGTPKGVAIEHKAAVNTIIDINERYQVTQADRILAVSELNFDLSVYDIFGILAAGGAIVIPGPEEAKDSACWWKWIISEKISLWNSVPALFQMLVDYVEGSNKEVNCQLREVMLSGDWIPLDLSRRAKELWPDMKIHSQGGATEASIWSICYPIDKVKNDWQSIPYGQPLSNQTFHVLNESLEPCPDWVTGELFIGGVGLARGYWKDKEKTDHSFIIHPKSNERLYRTGDLGRYMPDGNIEFLGREDYQVKVNGYRIELGEIETVLCTHPDITEAVVCALGEERGKNQLVAYVVLKSVSSNSEFENKHNQFKKYLNQQIPAYMVPKKFILLEKIPLTRNGKIDRNALPKPLDLVGQSAVKNQAITPLQALLSQIFIEELKLEKVDVNDSFFELGGDSLSATRLVATISKEFDIDFYLRDLFQAPTITELAVWVNDLKPVSAESNTQELLTRIFTEALKLENVDINDSFFDLGGDSLSATSLVAAISKEFGVDIYLRDLFQAPTIAELEAQINDLKSTSTDFHSKPDEELAIHEEEGEL
jgi:amino acid adenylation domain-containing protein